MKLLSLRQSFTSLEFVRDIIRTVDKTFFSEDEWNNKDVVCVTQVSASLISTGKIGDDSQIISLIGISNPDVSNKDIYVLLCDNGLQYLVEQSAMLQFENEELEVDYMSRQDWYTNYIDSDLLPRLHKQHMSNIDDLTRIMLTSVVSEHCGNKSSL